MQKIDAIIGELCAGMRRKRAANNTVVACFFLIQTMTLIKTCCENDEPLAAGFQCFSGCYGVWVRDSNHHFLAGANILNIRHFFPTQDVAAGWIRRCMMTDRNAGTRNVYEHTVRLQHCHRWLSNHVTNKDSINLHGPGECIDCNVDTRTADRRLHARKNNKFVRNVYSAMLFWPLWSLPEYKSSFKPDGFWRVLAGFWRGFDGFWWVSMGFWWVCLLSRIPACSRALFYFCSSASSDQRKDNWRLLMKWS